ncbi:MAG: transposase [Luteimonas sp.]
MPSSFGHNGHLLRRGRASLPCHAYHISTTTRVRQPLFADFQAACAACRCFETLALLGDAQMLAWVLMPDHVHWLLQLGERDSLACVVNRLKSASARSTNASKGRKGPVWARSYFDHAVRTDEDLATIARYIVANPLRAGLVPRVAQYPFWNAIWLPSR